MTYLFFFNFRKLILCCELLCERLCPHICATPVWRIFPLVARFPWRLFSLGGSFPFVFCFIWWLFPRRGSFPIGGSFPFVVLFPWWFFSLIIHSNSTQCMYIIYTIYTIYTVYIIYIITKSGVDLYHSQWQKTVRRRKRANTSDMGPALLAATAPRTTDIELTCHKCEQTGAFVKVSYHGFSFLPAM